MDRLTAPDNLFGPFPGANARHHFFHLISGGGDLEGFGPFNPQLQMRSANWKSSLLWMRCVQPRRQTVQRRQIALQLSEIPF